MTSYTTDEFGRKLKTDTARQQDKKRKTLVSYNSIVEGIEVMLESSKCTYKNGTKLETGGAIFHPTNWYVFAGKCWPDKR